VQATGGWVKKREPGRPKKKKRGACNVMCDARWRGGLLDFGWAGRVGRGGRRLIEDADRVRVSTQAGGGALCGEAACVLRRGIATTGGGLWKQTAVLCLLPVVAMSVCPCPCPCPCHVHVRRPRWLRLLGDTAAARQITAAYFGGPGLLPPSAVVMPGR
jgi:hypothetical protein